MKTLNTSNSSNPVEIARARLTAAENLVQAAKIERRAAKHRRKQADLAARRAKKELRRAREELDDARSAFTTAEANYSEQLKKAIRAKKRPRPQLVRAAALKKKPKKQLRPKRSPAIAAAPSEPFAVETARDLNLSPIVSSPSDAHAVTEPADQVGQQAGGA